MKDRSRTAVEYPDWGVTRGCGVFQEDEEAVRCAIDEKK
jgi:hypothetical protein